MNQTKNTEDIEIPWALVREFSKSSALPPALPKHSGAPRLTATSGSKHRGTPMSVDAAMFAGDRSRCYNTPQFPSLPASPDLVSPFRRHPGKKVPYNVLHAYVVGSTPHVAPVNTTFTPKASPRLHASKKASQSKVDVHSDEQGSDTPICPSVRGLVKTRQGKRKQITLPERQTSHLKEETSSTEFPQVSPLGCMYHYSQMWSPVEEKKLVDIWKKGPDVRQKSNLSETNRSPGKNKPVPQYLLATTTNNRGRDFTSNERASMFRYREVVTSTSEPPAVATSPVAYITTWLEAGGDVPKFLKSV